MGSSCTTESEEHNLILTRANRRVKIREDLKKGLIFGLEARQPIGIILGFVGYAHQVMPLMQLLSHGTRAYIVNAEGLRGFVTKFNIVYYLRWADRAGLL